MRRFRPEVLEHQLNTALRRWADVVTLNDQSAGNQVLAERNQPHASLRETINVKPISLR